MEPGAVTELLAAWRGGDTAARDRMIELVYDELHSIAQRQLARERSNHTLQPTALVHEAFMRLAGQRKIEFNDRAHLLGVAAQVMRRILIDHARRHGAAKRDAQPVTVTSIESLAVSTGGPEPNLIALDAALDALAAFDPRAAKVVELRFFGGLEWEEAATALEISPATAKRDWTAARAWLLKQLHSA